MNKVQMKQLLALKHQLDKVGQQLQKYLEIELDRVKEEKLAKYDGIERSAYYCGKLDAQQEAKWPI